MASPSPRGPAGRARPAQSSTTPKVQKKNQLNQTVTAKTKQFTDAAVPGLSPVDTAMAQKDRVAAAAATKRRNRPAETAFGSGNKVTRQEPAETRMSSQESTETRIHIAEAVAEAAERVGNAIGTLPGWATESVGALWDRAGSTIGTLPDRMANRQRYAFIGAALAVSTVVAVLIRRLR